VIAVLGLSFIVNAFKTVPVALLQREFRFKFLAFNEGCQAIVMALGEVALALMGFGYWSLVIRELLASRRRRCWRSPGGPRLCRSAALEAQARHAFHAQPARRAHPLVRTPTPTSPSWGV
jgi:hypothetical protein